MRSALIAVLVTAAAVAAGCGGGTKTVTTNSQPSQSTGSMSTGTAGTMGPPPSGSQYDATNPTVDRHIETVIETYAAAHGIPNAQASCTGDSPSQATCQVSNPANGKSVTATVSVDQTTGQLNITNVS